MFDRLIHYLECYVRLSPEDLASLTAAASKHVRHVGARHDLVREGDRARSVIAVLEGWACRYKQLPDGRRQIVSILTPGDLCDANFLLPGTMDYSVAAVTPCSFAEIDPAELEALAARSPRIATALRRHEMVTASTQREWTLTVGRRTASERVGHLICELFTRLKATGSTRQNECDFPLTQNDIADATGLTAVHINRTLQELRSRGLIVVERRTLTILDLERLMDLSAFDPDYLHLPAIAPSLEPA